MTKPQGAFYFFPKSPVDDDVAFAEVLQEWHVLVVPGRGFGTPSYFRISYCLEDRVLEGAMDGFAQAAPALRFITIAIRSNLVDPTDLYSRPKTCSSLWPGPPIRGRVKLSPLTWMSHN